MIIETRQLSFGVTLNTMSGASPFTAYTIMYACENGGGTRVAGDPAKLMWTMRSRGLRAALMEWNKNG